MELGKSVSSYRLHNQGVPNKITYYTELPPKESLEQQLRNIGHVVTGGSSKCVTQAVAKLDGHILAMSDPRKDAKADGY